MEIESSEEILINMRTSYSRSTDSFQLLGWAEELGQSSLQPYFLSVAYFPSFLWAMPQPMNMKFVLISLLQWFLDVRTLHFLHALIFMAGDTDNPR